MAVAFVADGEASVAGQPGDEFVHRHRFGTRAEAALRIVTWITGLYNPTRRHSLCGGGPSPADQPGIRVLLALVGLEGTIGIMTGRKRHSAEEIVRKLRRADELAAEGRTGEQVAAELGVSAATLYNWRRQYGGMDTDAAKQLKELREQNARLKRLLTDAELEKDALREISKDAPIDVKWS